MKKLTRGVCLGAAEILKTYQGKYRHRKYMTGVCSGGSLVTFSETI